MKPTLMLDLQEAIALSRFWTEYEPSDKAGEQQRAVSCILLAYIDVLEQEIGRLNALQPAQSTAAQCPTEPDERAPNTP
ncbi:MAG: hypothetical protein JO171_07290 [Paludibacterium sp.]|uniref:hypothetical protein n=1 Tax=Paludibacterium sp. TaxID=1917523 RepID=UPI0025FA7209|nr:hypothetical protein [Paludibacterium sp.]MBV8046938.1 hypothetical protein [Paludibacterium sp.]MBV8646531.1 hypothetical protein [Paludibacterium sp.]